MVGRGDSAPSHTVAQSGFLRIFCHLLKDRIARIQQTILQLSRGALSFAAAKTCAPCFASQPDKPAVSNPCGSSFRGGFIRLEGWSNRPINPGTSNPHYNRQHFQFELASDHSLHRWWNWQTSACMTLIAVSLSDHDTPQLDLLQQRRIQDSCTPAIQNAIVFKVFGHFRAP